MPSRIPDEKIAEWKALAENTIAAGAGLEHGDSSLTYAELALLKAAEHVIPALLAEREELLREIDRLTTQDVEVHDPGDGVRFVTISVQAHDAEQRQRTADWLKRADRDRESMLALLRDCQWAACDLGDARPTPRNMCPECGARRARGHSPDCRLAAFLRGSVMGARVCISYSACSSPPSSGVMATSKILVGKIAEWTALSRVPLPAFTIALRTMVDDGTAHALRAHVTAALAFVEAVPALLSEREEMLAEVERLKSAPVKVYARRDEALTEMSHGALLWENRARAAEVLLRDEVLPFVEHTITAYDCAKGIALESRLDAFLRE